MAERADKPSKRKMSRSGRLNLARWTFFGTLGCLSVSITFNWLLFRPLGDEVLLLGILSATVLPIVLAGPLFFYLTLKLRELAIANHKLSWLASTDSLTGCTSRGAFTQFAEEWLACTSSDPAVDGTGALLLVDADHFKSVNDRFGHHQGDEALKLIAGSITSAVRSGDWVGRLGGEEFGVLLPRATLEEAKEVAERIRVAVGEARFVPKDRRHVLSVSVGCAAFERPAHFSDLFRIADASLYEAKRRGRNRVVLGSAPSIEPTLENLVAAQ